MLQASHPIIKVRTLRFNTLQDMQRYMDIFAALARHAAKWEIGTLVRCQCPVAAHELLQD